MTFISEKPKVNNSKEFHGSDFMDDNRVTFIHGQNHFHTRCQTLTMKTQCLHSASVLGLAGHVGQGHPL